MDDHVDATRVDTGIDSLEDVVNVMASSCNFDQRWPFGVENLNYLVIEIILEIPLMGNFERRISKTPNDFAKSPMSTLMSILQHPTPDPTHWPVQIHDKVRLTLKRAQVEQSSLDFKKSWEWLLVQCIPVSITRSSSSVAATKPEIGPKFLTTLNEKLFQLFLDCGADPNSKMSAATTAMSYLQEPSLDMPSNLSAFERFIALVSDLATFGSHEAVYISALDSFLRAGAKLRDVIEFTDMKNDCVARKPRILTPLLTDMEDALSTRPESRNVLVQVPQRIRIPLLTDMEDALSTRPESRNFLVQVAQRILPLADEAGWPLDDFKRTFDRMLPGYQDHILPNKKGYSASHEATTKDSLSLISSVMAAS
ncbi:unnamed protein product [Clonostachys rosea]|uniref:Uncharacterized protein n=1 Tax=Bionectria ochroleuca TaxID=29856 RepID=A0ABY6UC15_BIOOC|nr:unnamed protein product [Clonostachys rosea]